MRRTPAQVLGTRVEGGLLVVQMRLTVNVTALTLEQQLSKRRRLVQQMCTNIEQELRADLATDEWRAMALLRGAVGTDGRRADGHSHAEATLRAAVRAACSEPPEYYNCDDKWGDAIARAVAASKQVGEGSRTARPPGVVWAPTL